jgi:hypothetical protein
MASYDPSLHRQLCRLPIGDAEAASVNDVRCYRVPASFSIELGETIQLASTGNVLVTRELLAERIFDSRIHRDRQKCFISEKTATGGDTGFDASERYERLYIYTHPLDCCLNVVCVPWPLDEAKRSRRGMLRADGAAERCHRQRTL